MARFCTNCGTPIVESSKFCAKCGAKTGPEPVGSAANAPPAARATSPAAPVGTPGARSGSSGVKVLLIVLGVFTGLTVLGIGSCVYVGYRIKRKIEETVKVDKAGESGQTVTISTPGGQIKLSDRTGQRAGSEIGGVPPYPGSNPVEGGAKLSFGGIGEIAGQEYLTSDPVDKVVAFYKDKFGEKLSIIENQGHFRLALYDVQGSGATTIDVEQDGEGTKTKIFIAHIGK